VVRGQSKDALTSLGARANPATTLAASTVLGVSEDAFLAFVEREPAAKEAFERGKTLGRLSLRRKQFKRAETAAAILLGKKSSLSRP
jgi:hypothetical protein